MKKLSPLQKVRQLTGKQKTGEAKAALAKSLVGKLPKSEKHTKTDAAQLKTLSNSQLLRLCKRHAPELLGAAKS